MASSSRKRHYSDDHLEMSPEKAKSLFAKGGVLIVRNMPLGAVFGIDLKVYQIGEKFLGLKMIPPGFHFIYYSAVSKEGCAAPRTGFFHFFKPQEVLVKKWDNVNETLITVDTSEDEIHRIRLNLLDLDRSLGAYPYQTLKQWNRLTCNISETLVENIKPLSGVVNSVTELIPLDYPVKESCEPDSSTERRHQTLEEKYLPNMEKVPGTEIRFTEIPKLRYPEGSSAAEITRHSMDSTYILEQLLNKYAKEDDLLGELQMAHVCFLIAHVYDAFEHWKNLVQIFASVDSGLKKYESLFTTFLTILHYQLKEIPTDFFIDITSENNFLLNTLQIFFENIKNSNTDENFRKLVDNFRKNLTSIYKWDFESVPEEDQPVVVDL